MKVQRSLDELQNQLQQWDRPADKGQRVAHTVLAVPSLSLPFFGIQSIEQMLHYEERIFYLFHILRNPLNRLIVVTSSPVTETLVSYLLHLLPGVPHSHARRRLELLHVQDNSSKPLAQKILDRPALMTRLRRLLSQSPRATISCYNVTQLEEELAVALQVPLHGPRAEHLRLTSNSGSRQLFQALGMTHPRGTKDVQYIGDVARALIDLAREQPGLSKACVKHNFSISGYGNAIVDLAPLQERLQKVEEVDNLLHHWVMDNLPAWTDLVHERQTWDSYLERLGLEGGAVEEFVEGDPCSVQVRIDLDGSVDVIGTHEELMGGENSQVYLGCRFPASHRLARSLGEQGRKLGEWMAEQGVVGRFTANFLATPKGGESVDRLYAVDVHLRKGNTTLPLRTLQLLSGGKYQAEEGRFTDDRGQELCYLSSDHFGAGHFKGMMPRDLLEIITCSSHHYSSTTHTGAVFHMLNGISELGQTGITCIERRPELAEQLYYAVYQELEKQRGGYEWMT
ncbi:MAG: hypothetical protein WC314_09975 [Vulcanimicrobiota bacterium]